MAPTISASMKEWWKTLFNSLVGELFASLEGKNSRADVEQILKKVKLPKNGKILDLACGAGRHSVLLAKKKFKVIGLDFSRTYLSVARKYAREEGVSVEFIRGDMKKLNPHFESDEFDMIISLWNSFGYFKKRRDDTKMLKEIYRVLKPGGFFVLNTLSGEGVKMALKQPLRAKHEPIKNVFWVEKTKFDKRQRKRISDWIIIDERKRKVKIFRTSYQQNIYTMSELTTLLQRTGFRIERRWGLLRGGYFRPKTSLHLTLVAKKPVG